MERFVALRDLHVLERDFRSVTRGLTATMVTMDRAGTYDSLFRVLYEAEEELQDPFIER